MLRDSTECFSACGDAAAPGREGKVLSVKREMKVSAGQVPPKFIQLQVLRYLLILRTIYKVLPDDYRLP